MRLIPLPVTTYGLWEENAAANLLEIVQHQINNLHVIDPNLKKNQNISLSVSQKPYYGKMEPCC